VGGDGLLRFSRFYHHVFETAIIDNIICIE